jgi:hypothetical protein
VRDSLTKKLPRHIDARFNHSMALQYTKAEPITLRGHSDFNEAWLQKRIVEDPSILDLGDVEVIERERRHDKAGRLDLLLYDRRENTRYEVELMLGATDESHIIRCLEYWDIERRRYPNETRNDQRELRRLV